LAREAMAMAAIPIKERQLVAELQRLTRESDDFRRAVTEYLDVERRYEEARNAGEAVVRTSVSIIDTVAAHKSGRSVQADRILPPQPVELVTPEEPANLRGAGGARDGWVKLRYWVQGDGRTAEVRAIDTMPPWLDVSSAVEAAQSWTFESATDEGVPVDWHYNEAVIVFSGTKALHEHWTLFAEAYEEVAELIAGGQYVEAKALNEQMQRESMATLEEIGLAQMQLAAIEHALGDTHAALAAIRRATEPGIGQLADEQLRLALEHRFALELQLGRAADALRTYERRAALGELRPLDPLARQGTTLRQSLGAPGVTLAVQARIDGKGRWEYPLTWGSFEVGDLDGHGEGFEVECHRERAALPFAASVAVTIPSAWGECVLTARGRPDTRFTLYEFSDIESEAAPSLSDDSAGEPVPSGAR